MQELTQVIAMDGATCDYPFDVPAVIKERGGIATMSLHFADGSVKDLGWFTWNDGMRDNYIWEPIPPAGSEMHIVWEPNACASL